MSRDRCFVIAEAGVNHNGDLGTARSLVAAAAEAGADAVKFQSFVAHDIVTSKARLARYQAGSPLDPEVATQYDMLERLQLNRTDFEALKRHCHDYGIEFMSSAFGLSDLEMLISVGVRRLKVPSGEITNLPYLRAIARTQLPVVLSSGMASLSEIRWAVEIMEAAGMQRQNLTILQCTSSYPTHLSDANLNAMGTIAGEFNTNVGFSDHTTSQILGAVAVALGASVIEKHITLDKASPGPDHAASLDPTGFTRYVSNIRDTEMALGDGSKDTRECELELRTLARKSIVAARPIRSGTVIRAQDLTLKRPASGVPASLWDDVVGSVASRDYEVDDLVDL